MGYDIFVPKRIPIPQTDVKFVKNGARPDWRFGQSIAQKLNHLTCNARKVVFTKARHLNNFPGLVGTTSHWRFQFRTGYAHTNGLELRAKIILHASSNVAADPAIYLELSPGPLVSNTVHWRRLQVATEKDNPNNLAYRTLVVPGLASNTTYTARFVLTDYCTLVAATVYEQHASAMLESDAMTAPERHYYDGADITYQDEDRLRDISNALYDRNGAHLISYAVTDTTARTTTSATYVNLIDTGTTTVTADTLGYQIQVRYHDTQINSNVPCVLAAYGNSSAAGTGKVALVDSGGTLAEVTLPTTTDGWASTAFNLAKGTSDTFKADLHFKNNGVATSTVYAVCLYEEV